jgi:hypothetical protein
MRTHLRREFLLRVLAACGTPFAALVASASAAPRLQRESDSDVDFRLAATYFGAGVDAARSIGEAYLRHLNVEPTRASILQHTTNALQLLTTARSPEATFTALVAAVRGDFGDGRVVVLEGWVLSRTEVELCALTLLPAAI